MPEVRLVPSAFLSCTEDKKAANALAVARDIRRRQAKGQIC